MYLPRTTPLPTNIPREVREAGAIGSLTACQVRSVFSLIYLGFAAFFLFLVRFGKSSIIVAAYWHASSSLALWGFLHQVSLSLDFGPRSTLRGLSACAIRVAAGALIMLSLLLAFTTWLSATLHPNSSIPSMRLMGFAVGVVHGIFHLLLLQKQDRATTMDFSSVNAYRATLPESAVVETPDRAEHTETESESEAEQIAEYP